MDHWSDPDFQKLHPSVQREVLNATDTDFAKIPASEQDRVVFQMRESAPKSSFTGKLANAADAAVDVTRTVGKVLATPVVMAGQGLGALAVGGAELAKTGNIDKALQAGSESIAQSAETMAPKTTAGQNVEKVVSYPFQKWSELGEKMVGDSGSPTLDAVKRTAWELAPFAIGSRPKEGKATPAPATEMPSEAKFESRPPEPAPVSEVQRPTHDNLADAAVTAADSLELQAAAPSVKPVVKGTVAEVQQLVKDGAAKGKQIFKAGDTAYIIDPVAVQEIYGGTKAEAVRKAKVDLKAGNESALLGYPERPAPGEGIDAAVTKQGEIVTDLPAMKQQADSGNLAWAAEGRPEDVTAKAQDVANAMRKEAPPTSGGIPKVSAEEALREKSKVVAELAVTPEDSPRSAELQTLLEQYKSIIDGEAKYEDFQPPSLKEQSNAIKTWQKQQGNISQRQEADAGRPPAEASGGNIAEQGGQGQAGEIAAGSLAFGQELPKYAGNINLERVGADYSAKKLILDVSDRYKGQIDEARRGKITLDETKALANDLGMTVDDLLSRKKGEAYNAEQVTAARDILNTSAQRLRKVQEMAAQLGSEEALLEFRKAMNQHAMIQAEVSGSAAEAGRALSAHRIMSAPSKAYKEMLDVLGGKELNEKMLKRFAGVDPTNMVEVNRFIREFSKVKTTSMLYEAWINFLLSGPLTHIANSVSNGITAVSRLPEKVIASGLSKDIPIGEVKAEAVGMWQGMKDGVHAAVKALKEEMPADRLVKEGGYMPAIPGKTGRIIRLPGSFLSAADEFFKSVNYAAELNAKAFRQAKSEGLVGDHLSTRTAEIVANPSKEMIQAAKYSAEYRTYTNQLGTFGNKLMALRNDRSWKGALFRVIVPFFRTPTNIAKFTLERTPLDFIRIGIKSRKGELRGPAMAEEMAKPLLGSAIGATFAIMATEGLVTGGGPKSKPERETLLRTGWQPYSFKIGDQYLSYARMEPLSSIVGMTADAVELLDSGKEKQAMDYIEAAMFSMTKNLTSKTFLKGISGALDALSDPRRYGPALIESYAGSLVPAAVGQVAREVDDTIRQVEGPMETIQSRIPVASQSLPPRRDLWGREVKRGGTEVERAISPMQRSTASDNVVDKEMARIGIAVGMPKKDIGGNKLTGEQYDRYVKEAGEASYPMAYIILTSNMPDQSKEVELKNAISKIRHQVANRLAAEWGLQRKRK